MYRRPRKLVFRQFAMASNSTSSTDTGVPQSTPTQAPPSSATSLEPQSSSSPIANSSPTSVPTTEPPTTSSIILPTTSSSIPTTSSSIETTSSTTSSSIPTTSSAPPTTSSAAPTTPTTTSPSLAPTSFTITSTNSQGVTVTVIQTSTQTPPQNTRTSSSTSSAASSAKTAGLQDPGSSSKSSGLSNSGTIAVAVVVPIVAVAILIVAGLFFWRKRKARKDAEELRRKEVEEYGYNPNNDPTLPAVGGVGSSGHDGSYEMREDGSSGYRGWGTTAVASSGRKASTTVSGGQSAGGIGMAYSEGTSPTHGPVSDTRSDNPLMDGRATSPEAEALGAMGPAASSNRNGDINRGPSNASSSYSAAARSDGSGDVMAGGGQYYNNQYDTGNPYSGETQYGSPPGRAEMPAQPVIRDVQARRNTRIENPSHFPQQSAGISQNF
ncbi:hypothetical protein ONS95_003227 [Cadophora gregata]|uniref:uncharacterized protein n=1 Tax=Cadophora gregata TaxID=51156 RepID=UPI0026DCA224|nr:uncharacterized protein ONS95_003227 [Cadophora gregata]KAK0108419.1 hypothetical protein ONS95_003227 [Cadophora gregata]KAK0108987.1 hypothetical protein ONS96_002824 [Cadophora gregata f. sp. sojae]